MSKIDLVKDIDEETKEKIRIWCQRCCEIRNPRDRWEVLDTLKEYNLDYSKFCRQCEYSEKPRIAEIFKS